MKGIDNNDNDDKYNNNKHMSIEIVNSEKIETTCDEYISRVSKPRKEQISRARRVIKTRKNQGT